MLSNRAKGLGRLLISIMSITGMLALSGCGTIITPQSREEFKQQVLESPTLALTDTYTVNRRFEDVTQALERKWQECYSVSRTTTRTENNLRTMHYRENYHPRSQKINNSLFELTLQETSQGITMLNKIPPGGMYLRALNVERQGNNSKLTWYSYAAGRGRAHWERNKQWGEGKDLPCED